MVYSDKGHLAYYKEFEISPVRYDSADLSAHFSRRSALYRHLGLPEVAFRNVRVAEVAPGSGLNSLYIANLKPKIFDLIEPNPSAISDIKKMYGKYELEYTPPSLHERTLQDFNPEILYDIVVCENWLGALPNERILIKKLADLIVPGGALVLTIVPTSGFAPNVIRKLLADKLLSSDMDFEMKTEMMVSAFGPHLETIKSMTRSHVDWVRDCMINPHYLNVALSLDIVLEDIGDDMEILSSSPEFNSDWRWFKSLVGQERKFNSNFKSSHARNIHNFVDYREKYPERDVGEGHNLMGLFSSFHREAINVEKKLSIGYEDFSKAVELVSNISEEMSSISPHFKGAFEEAANLLDMDNINVEDVANMKYFKHLFGRETIYTSYIKK